MMSANLLGTFRAAILAVAVTLTGTVAVAATIDYSAAATGGGSISATVTHLMGALDSINNVTTTGTADTTVVTIDIDGDLTLNPTTDSVTPAFGWQLHGTDSPTDYPDNGGATYYGFSSVTISGETASGGRSTITVDSSDNNTNLLRVVHVQDSIAIRDLNLTGANFTASNYTDYSEVGGGGLMLGGNGIGDVAHKAPDSITLADMTINDNKITLTNAGAGLGNAFGAGVYIVGIGSDGTGPDTSRDSSTVRFENVDLKDNVLTFQNTVGGASIRGGGGRVSYVDGFTYDGGVVSGNQVIGTAVDHASGGGLSVDGGLGFRDDIVIKGVTFDANSVSVFGESAGTLTSSSARGGGFYSLVNYADTGNTIDITFDADTSFTGNSVTANRGGSANYLSAWGGGAFIYVNEANAKFQGTEFTGNTATSLYGDAGGGAIAIGVYTELPGYAANGKLTVTGAEFLQNSADATTEAYGGAVYVMAGAGTGHTLSGNTYTSNTATATATGGQAMGGALAVLSGNNKLTNESFVSNKATVNSGLNGGAARGGAAFFANGANEITSSEFKTNTADGANGTAMGGAIYLDAGTAGTTITNGIFEGNRAIASDFAGGGAIHSEVGGHTITGGTYKGNSVTASSAYGYAWGGAVSFYSGGHIITDAKFLNNTAEGYSASGGALFLLDNVANTATGIQVTGNKAIGTAYANGGGIHAQGMDFSLSNSTVSNNTVTADVSAVGGGIVYVNHSGGDKTLTLTNTAVTGNRLTSSGDAYGSAIYVDMVFDTAVNLVAEANKTTNISGNAINGHLDKDGIYFAGGGAAAELNVSGAGTVIIDNGMGASLGAGSSLAVTKSGNGRLEWNGVNSFGVGGATTISLQDGEVYLGKSFTAVATGGDYEVAIANGVDIEFDAERDGTLAMFDFTRNGGGDAFEVGDGTGKVNLTAGVGRSVYSESREYTVASGLANDELQDAKAGFTFQTSYPYMRDASIYIDGDKLMVGYDFLSPFDNSGPNAKSAQGPLDDLLSITPPISDEEWAGVLANARAAYPELYLDQARIMMNAVDFMARTAVDYGVRTPHRTRMRTELGYVPEYVPGETIGRYDDYGEPTRQGYVYNDSYYESSSAYPSSVLETCGKLLPSAQGLRLWAGYAGNWQNMSSHGGLNGYKADLNGFLIGLNYDFGAAASVGVYGGYSKTEANAKKIRSSVQADAAHFGIVGRLSPLSNYREFSLYADAGYHFATNDFSRDLGGWGATGSFDQQMVTLGIGAEYVVCLGTLNVTPHAELRYAYLDQEGMTESGSSSTITRIDGFDKSSMYSALGVELSKDYHLTRGVLSPAFNLAWRHDYGGTNFTSDAYYRLSPSQRGFNLMSSRTDRDSLDIGVAVKALHGVGDSSKMSLNVGYNWNVSRHSSTHSLYAGLEVGF